MAYASVLGHDRIKELLARAVQRGRLPPALLLSGPEGVGKRTLALSVSRALLCEKANGDCCDRCAACSRALRRLHPDLFLVEPETAVIKIEQVRDLVREISGLPFEGRARAFVVDQAHVLTEQAANALLKSLEEPPATSHVFLVTASPQALLPTIRSRCHTLRFGPLPQAALVAYLRERIGLAPEEARLRASLAGGSLGAAVAFESDEFKKLRNELLTILERVESLSVLERMEAAEGLAEHADLALVLTALRSLLRDALALRAGASAQSLLNTDVADRLMAVARGPVGERAGAVADAAEETRVALRGNAHKLLSVDALLETLAV